MSNFDKDLVIAAENGELEKVKVALKNGASPDAKGPLSGALHVSSYNCFTDIVKLYENAPELSYGKQVQIDQQVRQTNKATGGRKNFRL